MDEEINDEISNDETSEEINENILQSIKLMLGLMPNDTSFDSVIVMHINSTFLDLQQLGVGPEDGFSLDNSNSKWEEFIPKGPLLNAVKPYVYLNVKMLFDPPTNTATIDSINRQIARIEWRISIETEAEKIDSKGDEPDEDLEQEENQNE